MNRQNKRENYMSYWHFSKQEKDALTENLATQLPALRGAVGATQAEIASAIGISRQSYGCIENQQRKMSWNVYMSLIFFFDYTPNSHDLIRKPGVFPKQLDKLLSVSILDV